MYRILILILLLIPGCKIIRPTEHTTTETVREIYHDTTITVAGGEVSVRLDSSTLAEITKRLRQGEKEVNYVDPKSKAKLTFREDKNGAITVTCESLEQKFNFLLKEIQRLKLEQKTTTKTIEKTPWYNWAIFGLLLTGLITALLRKK